MHSVQNMIDMILPNDRIYPILEFFRAGASISEYYLGIDWRQVFAERGTKAAASGERAQKVARSQARQIGRQAVQPAGLGRGGGGAGGMVRGENQPVLCLGRTSRQRMQGVQQTDRARTRQTVCQTQRAIGMKKKTDDQKNTSGFFVLSEKSVLQKYTPWF